MTIEQVKLKPPENVDYFHRFNGTLERLTKEEQDHDTIERGVASQEEIDAAVARTCECGCVRYEYKYPNERSTRIVKTEYCDPHYQIIQQGMTVEKFAVNAFLNQEVPTHSLEFYTQREIEFWSHRDDRRECVDGCSYCDEKDRTIS